MKDYSKYTVGLAAENLVVAELLRRGIIATNFAGNVPVFDIITYEPNTNAFKKIQVKSKHNAKTWQTSLDRHFEVHYNEESEEQSIGDWKDNTPLDTVCIMVHLEKYGKDRFFILYYSELREILKNSHEKYLAENGGRRPKGGNSMHSGWGIEQLEPYEDNWVLLYNLMAGEVDKFKIEGFEGFHSIKKIRDGDVNLPKHSPGVYIVLRTEDKAPEFINPGTAGHFKGQNPNIDISTLKTKWIAETQVLYIGSTERNLHERITELVEYGTGKSIGHEGGKHMWQIKKSNKFLVCWKCMSKGKVKKYKERLISNFLDHYGGQKPFANMK